MRLIDDYSHYHFILWTKSGQIRHYDLLFMAFEFLEEDFDYLMCLKFDAPLHIFNPDLHELMKAIEEGLTVDHTLILLTQRKKPPLYVVNNDELIYSFSCNFDHFKSIVTKHRIAIRSAKNLLFYLLDLIGNGNTCINRIIAWQIPLKKQEHVVPRAGDVVIPHRGNNNYLKNLLFFLNQVNHVNVFVGLDQTLAAKDLALCIKSSKSKESPCSVSTDEEATSIYAFKPNPVGPYVIRNWLASAGTSDLIFFQDSDDIPCANRFELLASHMIKNEIPLCGSHEIKMDYFNRTVQAVRYPLDVIQALEHGPGHTLLHPSSAITRSAYQLCNRLSEERIFGNDTKFLYYSYFKLNKIANIDEFLYIRRSHPGSLTTSPGTGIGSVIRTQLKNQWVVDFTLVKLGVLKLEDSCLNFVGSKRKFKVRKLL